MKTIFILLASSLAIHAADGIGGTPSGTNYSRSVRVAPAKPPPPSPVFVHTYTSEGVPVLYPSKVGNTIVLTYDDPSKGSNWVLVTSTNLVTWEPFTGPITASLSSNERNAQTGLVGQKRYFRLKPK